MCKDRGATEQSSGIATGRIEGETDAEGLEDGELPRSKHSRASKRRVARDEGPRQMAWGPRKVEFKSILNQLWTRHQV